VGPPRGHKSCQQTCSSAGNSPWVHRSCQEPDPAWALHEVTASFGHMHLLQNGVLHSCRWRSAPPWTSMGCRGISALAPEAPPSPLFSLNLGVCRVVSVMCSHSSLWLQLCSGFFSLLKYVIAEALPPLLVGLALASGRCVLEPAGLGSVGDGGSFWHRVREANPVPPCTTKTLPRKPHTINLAVTLAAAGHLFNF